MFFDVSQLLSLREVWFNQENRHCFVSFLLTAKVVLKHETILFAREWLNFFFLQFAQLLSHSCSIAPGVLLTRIFFQIMLMLLPFCNLVCHTPVRELRDKAIDKIFQVSARLFFSTIAVIPAHLPSATTNTFTVLMRSVSGIRSSECAPFCVFSAEPLRERTIALIKFQSESKQELGLASYLVISGPHFAPPSESPKGAANSTEPGLSVKAAEWRNIPHTAICLTTPRLIALRGQRAQSNHERALDLWLNSCQASSLQARVHREQWWLKGIPLHQKVQNSHTATY